jgi:hypothetical protein
VRRGGRERSQQSNRFLARLWRPESRRDQKSCSPSHCSNAISQTANSPNEQRARRAWGEGKREGFIGGFICEDLSGTLKVKVGSGFTDLDLQELSKDPDSHINNVCSVFYNVIINDKNNNWSLFLPRFVEIRHDKDLADDLKEKCK